MPRASSLEPRADRGQILIEFSLAAVFAVLLACLTARTWVRMVDRMGKQHQSYQDTRVAAASSSSSRGPSGGKNIKCWTEDGNLSYDAYVGYVTRPPKTEGNIYRCEEYY